MFRVSCQLFNTLLVLNCTWERDGSRCLDRVRLFRVSGRVAVPTAGVFVLFGTIKYWVETLVSCKKNMARPRDRESESSRVAVSCGRAAVLHCCVYYVRVRVRAAQVLVL